MINIIDEVGELLNEYNLNLNDVIFVFNGNVVENEDFLEKYDVFVIDDYTWFERTSYDGCEKFVLKAHPLLSKYQNRESHTEYFYER